MNTWLTVGIAVLPAVILLIFIYFQDKHEKEPVGLLLGIFGLGVLSAIPAILAELVMTKIIDVTFGGTFLLYHMVTAFFGVAVIEEGVKFLAAYLLTWRNKHFNYKFDGIVYCLFGSMGFAAIENVLYLFRTESNLVLGMGISRGLLAIPAHAMCAIFMGYYYGNAKFAKSYGDRSKCRKLLITGFLTACCLHGFYDFCIMTGKLLFIFLFVVFVVVADIFTIIRIFKAKKEDQKMYEAPQYRQYWVASNPYQSYGGYQAPTYGGYAQPNVAGMQMNPTAQNDSPYGAPNMQGSQPGYGAPNMQGSQPGYGAPNMPGYGSPNMPGSPQGAAGMQPEYGRPVVKDLYITEAPPKAAPVNNTSNDRNMLIHCPVCNEICSFHAFYCPKCGSAIHQLRDGYSPT